jgi:RNA polymerase sigma-70 factor (sigma-E family)
VRAADEAEFREYMTARWPALLRTAYLLTGDRHYAEDLAQTALEKAAVAWNKVRSADDVDAYVRRILVNTHLSRFRRRRVVEVLRKEIPEAASTDSSQQIAVRDELLKALATLPKRQCAVVVLRYWEDLTEAQTAAILGCSVGTVRSQSFKALAKLRVSPLLSDSAPLLLDMAKEGNA